MGQEKAKEWNDECTYLCIHEELRCLLCRYLWLHAKCHTIWFVHHTVVENGAEGSNVDVLYETVARLPLNNRMCSN